MNKYLYLNIQGTKIYWMIQVIIIFLINKALVNTRLWSDSGKVFWRILSSSSSTCTFKNPLILCSTKHLCRCACSLVKSKTITSYWWHFIIFTLFIFLVLFISLRLHMPESFKKNIGHSAILLNLLVRGMKARKYILV